VNAGNNKPGAGDGKDVGQAAADRQPPETPGTAKSSAGPNSTELGQSKAERKQSSEAKNSPKKQASKAPT
jgi:hypothetical protein